MEFSPAADTDQASVRKGKGAAVGAPVKPTAICCRTDGWSPPSQGFLKLNVLTLIPWLHVELW